MADLRVGVAVMPMATVLSLLADAAGKAQGVPPAWRSAIRAGLPADGLRTLAPLFGGAASNLPHCLTPSVSVRDTDFDAHFDQIVTAARQRLVPEVSELHGQRIPAVWQPVIRQPVRWIDAYAGTMRSAWKVFRPIWERARPLLDREIARVGTAAVRGALDGVLSALSPRWGYAAENLLIPDSQPGAFPVAGRRLVLTPTVSGLGASIFDPDCEDKVWLGYPVPGLSMLWQGQDRAPGDGDNLALVLGRMRARLVRDADGRLTMRQLAGALGCAPSVVTYHCAQLVDAGLLYRIRQGRQVLVGRTGRGDALLDLLA